MHVRIAQDRQRGAAIDALIEAWGEPVLVRGQAYVFADCEIFVAGDLQGVAAVSHRDKPVAELVAINAFTPRAGVGTALLEAIVASLDGFSTLRLTTTNDNLDALRFYQRRDFRLTALRPGAVDEARRRKPTIPIVGDYGLPIHDELDFCLVLRPREG